jgi:hypothetical protein
MAGFSEAARKASRDKQDRIESAVKLIKARKAVAEIGEFIDTYRGGEKLYNHVWKVTDTDGNVIFSEVISDARVRAFLAEGLTETGNLPVKVEPKVTGKGK